MDAPHPDPTPGEEVPDPRAEAELAGWWDGREAGHLAALNRIRPELARFFITVDDRGETAPTGGTAVRFEIEPVPQPDADKPSYYKEAWDRGFDFARSDLADTVRDNLRSLIGEQLFVSDGLSVTSMTAVSEFVDHFREFSRRRHSEEDLADDRIHDFIDRHADGHSPTPSTDSSDEGPEIRPQSSEAESTSADGDAEPRTRRHEHTEATVRYPAPAPALTAQHESREAAMRPRIFTRRGAIAAAFVGVISALSVRLLPGEEGETQSLAFAPNPQWRSFAPRTYAEYMAYHNALTGFESAGNVAIARQYVLQFLQSSGRADQSPVLIRVIQDTNRTPYVPELVAALAPACPDSVREAAIGALTELLAQSDPSIFSPADINTIVALEASGSETNFRTQTGLTQLAATLTGN